MFTAEAGKPQKSLFEVRQRMCSEGRSLHMSKVLSNAKIGLERVEFDPRNADHRRIFARFLLGRGWSDGVTFHVESPHMTVPATCVNKLLTYHLGVELQLEKAA